MNLHDQIMSIPCDTEPFSEERAVVYKLGHEHAKKSAAELAKESDATRDELLAALKYTREAIRTGKFTSTNIAHVDSLLTRLQTT